MAWYDEEDQWDPFGYDYSGNFGMSQQPSRMDNMFGDLSFGSPEQDIPSPLMMGRRRGMFGPSPDMPSYNQDPEDAYYSYLSQVPNRNDYQRGTMGKIAAGVLGAATGLASNNPMAAYQATQGFLDQPYKNALEDYKVAGTGKEAAMKQEQLRYNRAMSRYLQGQENARKTAATQADIEDKTTERKYKNAQIDKIQIEIDKLKNPQDWRTIIDDKGNVHLFNNDSGELKNLNIKSNELTFDQRKTLDNMNNAASLDRTIKGARERGAQDRENIGVREATSLGGDIARDALGLRNKPNQHVPTPSEQSDAEVLKATQRYRSSPAKYKGIIGKGLKISGNTVIYDPEGAQKANESDLQLLRELFPVTQTYGTFLGGKRR